MDMTTIQNVNNALDLPAGRIHSLLAPRWVIRRMLMAVTARFALEGGVMVVDAGNLFDFYSVARTLRKHSVDVEEALRRIHIARAFTCYQVVALLGQIPSVNGPIIVLDMLASFYDESVASGERHRLLRKSIAELNRLKRQAAIVVSAVHPKRNGPDEFVACLAENSDHVLRFETPAPAAVQLNLF